MSDEALSSYTVASSPLATDSDQQMVFTIRKPTTRSSEAYLLPKSPKMVHYPHNGDRLPFEASDNMYRLEQLADGIDQLETTMGQLAMVHTLLNDHLNESIASLIHGLTISMWCVDYPGVPNKLQMTAMREHQKAVHETHELESQITVARKENQQLREKLQQLKQQKAGPRGQRRPRALGQSNRVPPVVERLTRMPPPTRKPVLIKQSSAPVPATDSIKLRTLKERNTPNNRSRIPKPSLNKGRELGSKPNLNQPPRYLKGLFDS